MLKLKYLFNNSDLALMLLKNWNYDEDSLELLNNYRISSNAIYPFKNNGKLYFLRFVPDAEKDYFAISQELNFITILSNNGFNVPKIIESKFGNIIETKQTPWGIFHAVVFESVGSETLESIKLTDEIAYNYGVSLAKLHQISKEKVQSNIERNSVYDILNLIEDKFRKNGSKSDKLVKHIALLRTEFDKINKTDLTYGIIHYDYELDNIIYEAETQKLSAIDFDDCMYGYYGQDVERAINSIESEIEDFQDNIKTNFIRGYLDAGGNLDIYYQSADLFKKFANLYSYFRISCSIEEKWDNEPIWLENLRCRLVAKMTKYLKTIES